MQRGSLLYSSSPLNPLSAFVSLKMKRLEQLKLVVLVPMVVFACLLTGCGGNDTEVLPVDPAAAVNEETYSQESYGTSTDPSAN